MILCLTHYYCAPDEQLYRLVGYDVQWGAYPFRRVAKLRPYGGGLIIEVAIRNLLDLWEYVGSDPVDSWPLSAGALEEGLNTSGALESIP